VAQGEPRNLIELNIIPNNRTIKNIFFFILILSSDLQHEMTLRYRKLVPKNRLIAVFDLRD